MTTYGNLRTTVLVLADETGNSSAESIAEVGLHQTMKYVASKLELDSLVGSATHTWLSTDSDIDLYGSDFNITDASAPLEPLDMFVGKSGTTGLPYDYRRYLDWQRLKSVPAFEREWISLPSSIDRRPDRCFTVTPSNKVELYPEPLVGEVVTIWYRADPADYAAGTTPEIPSNWDHILVNGAVLYVEKVIKEEEKVINPYQLFNALDEQIREMERSLRGPRSRPQMTVSRSYGVNDY